MGLELMTLQVSEPKKGKTRKASSRLEKEIKQLRAESLGLDKAQSFKKGKKREK